MQLGNVGGGQSCIYHLHQLGLLVMIFNGHQCVNLWCIITIEMVIFDSLPFYINTLEESTHIMDSLGRNLSLNLTHHFVGQIWSFSTSFVFHIVLPGKRQLLMASCLPLTCAHCAAVRFTSHTACTQ